VAVILAIDVASISAKKSFALSLQALTGRSNYAITGAGQPIDETFYKTLRVDWGYRDSAPVVEGYISFPDLEDPTDPGKATPLTLLGVDPFADAQIRSWTGGQFQNSAEGRSSGLTGLIGSTDRVIATAATADRLSWEVGKSRMAFVGSQKRDLVLAGVFQPDSDRSSAALDNVLVTDISVAQAVFARYGQLDRIDLALTVERKEQLAKRLPHGLFLQRSGQSQETASQLSAAFHVNLWALSYLCLLVATFLIFNVVSFSVSHRRQSLGRLRILGITGRELAQLLVGEALLLGAVGSLLGVVFGLLLGRMLVPLVARTINDLYYVHAITQFSIDPFLIAKAFGSGLLATSLAAVVPAVMAAKTEPLELLRRVQLRGSNLRAAGKAFLGGLALLVAARLVLWHSSLAAGLFSLLLIVLGCSLTIPLLLYGFVSFLSRLTGRVSSRMGLRGISAFLGRTSLAAVALTIAVAATISIGMMVSSFRGTLLSWLETTLTADIYITLKDRAGLNSGAFLVPGRVEEAVRLEGVGGWVGQRVKRVPSESGETFLVGVRVSSGYRASLLFLDLADDGWNRFENGEGIFVTEPYSRRAGLEVGKELRIATPSGEKSLPVLGVYYSYAPDRNMAVIAAPTFQQMFADSTWSGLGLYLQEGVDPTSMASEVRRLFGEEVDVKVTGSLKKLAVEIFERTFTVTEVLRFLALGVAFIGVFLSLLALCFERSDEVRVLRALGMERRELFQLALVQSAVMGTLAGVLAFPLGTLLSYVMISVINRRAFGWTITFQTDWSATLECLVLAVGAALLAGLYPAWKWSHQNEEDALRERE
jgi:putative ABC transport system permease protein